MAPMDHGHEKSVAERLHIDQLSTKIGAGIAAVTFSIDERLKSHPGAARISAGVAAVTLGAAMFLGSGSSGAEQTKATTTTTVEVAAPTTTQPGTIKHETDESLKNGGYNCGHSVLEDQSKGKYDYSGQIEYLNGKPELAKNLIDFQVNDPRWGMGLAAWKAIEKHAIPSTDTPKTAELNSNKSMNTYAHLIHSTELPTAHEYVNFTCSDAKGNVTPVTEVGAMKLTGHVGGFEVTKEGLDAFEKTVKRGSNGEMMFDIIDLGEKEVDGAKEHLYMIVTESDGCLNPNRVRKPGEPETPTNTVPGTLPPSTTVPVTYPPKNDNQPVPGPGTGRGETPAVPATPDHGQTNPVGGTVPPTTEQRPTTTENHGTTTMPETTNPAPVDTVPPAPAG